MLQNAMKLIHNALPPDPSRLTAQSLYEIHGHTEILLDCLWHQTLLVYGFGKAFRWINGQLGFYMSRTTTCMTSILVLLWLAEVQLQWSQQRMQRLNLSNPSQKCAQMAKGRCDTSASSQTLDLW